VPHECPPPRQLPPLQQYGQCSDPTEYLLKFNSVPVRTAHSWHISNPNQLHFSSQLGQLGVGEPSDTNWLPGTYLFMTKQWRRPSGHRSTALD
jgi:hypothetical protein